MAEVHQGPLEIQRETVVESPVERADVGVLESMHRIRWGPVWAGVIVGLATYVVLLALGAGIALAAGATVTGSGWWAVVALLLSLFLGGYIAGMFTGAADTATSVTQGALVWAITLIALITLSALGAYAGIVASPAVSRFDFEQMANRQLGAAAAWWFVIGNVLAFIAAALGAYAGAVSRRQVTTTTRRAA
ncbi:MAG: hypothetical protein HY320_11715, partial [Armatimonadetes bacterium]|nr:hypothetical protein [Armatimonadota bacterium]